MEESKKLTKKMVHRTLINGTMDEILKLLKNKADLNYISEDTYYMGDTVLHAILRNEKLIERHVIDILTDLLSQGVGDPNIANELEQTSLHLAIERRMKGVIDILLEFEANINTVNEVGDSLAHFFIEDEYEKCETAMLYPIMGTKENREITESDSVSFLKFLISKGVDFDRRNESRNSALYLAVIYQLLHILPTLFEHTKDITFVDKDKTLLHYFLEERSLSLPDKHLRLNYNSEYATRCVSVLLGRQVPILNCEKYGCTLISKAIENKEETNVIKTLISYYLSNCDDVELATTLHDELMSTYNLWSPSEKEYFLVVLSDLETKIVDIKNKIQLNKSALIMKDIYNSDDSIKTPLHEAIAANRSLALIQSMLTDGADVNATDSAGNTPLHLAVLQNDVTIVRSLLEHGAPVDCKNKHQKTPLHFVRWTTNLALEIVDLLVSRGADVNAKDHTSETPFHLAVCNNNLAIVLLLLQSGASINCRNSFQMTPLHRALLSENVSMQMVQLLLSDGAKVNTKDYKGETPLHLAVSKNNLPIAQLLIEHGALVLCSNKYEQTPLHRAVINESVGIVELLLANGADVNVEDCEGNRPLHHICNRWTLDHNGERILKMLLEKGAHVNAQNDRKETALSLARPIENNILADELIKYSGLKVQCLEHPNRDIALQGYNDYLMETRKLHNTEIGHYDSLFDFLVMNAKHRCAYTNNEILQQLIKSPKLHELFPVYSCRILARYNEAVTRKSLEESAQEALYAMTRFQLPDSVDKILVHLKNEDLINIAQANVYDAVDDD